MTNKFKFLCYASGSNQIGFGHLYRLTRIIDYCGVKNQTLFIYQNSLEKFFLESRKFHLYNNQNIDPELILIDSRIDCSALIKSFKNNNELVIIDNLDKWTKIGDTIIFPSFYINENKIVKSLKNNGIKYIYGKDYAILSSPKLKNKKINNKILITFGGSDPNNITSKVLDILMETEFKDRLRIIFGPGYSHNKEKIIEKYKDLDFISDCKNMALEIGNSSIVITALGTTIQDIEYYGKKSIIICNYKDDLEDYNYISQMSRLKDKIKCIGIWDSFNKKHLTETIKKLDTIDDIPIDKEEQWSYSWKKLFNTYK